MVSRDGWDKVAKCLDCERDLACASCGMEQPEEHNNAAKVPSKASDEAKATLDEALGIIHDLLGLELGSSERAMKFLDDHAPTANDVRGIMPNTPADRKSEA